MATGNSPAPAKIKLPILTVAEPPAAVPPAAQATAEGLPPGDPIWDRVIRGILYALTFALPLLFTTWTFEPLEFSKEILLVALAAAALITWLLKVLVVRQVRFVKTPLDLPIGIFLLIYFLASLFSIDRVASFLGFYGSFQGNFFQVLFLILFFYLVVNNFQGFRDLRRLVGIFVFSNFLALLYAVLQFFGWFVIRVPIAKIENFNTIGGLLTLSLFAAFSVLLQLGFREQSWFSVYGGRLWRILSIIFAFLILLTVNFIYAWAALLVGLLLYLIFQMGYSKNFNVRNFLAPLVLLVIVIAFLISQWVFGIAPFRSIFSFNLPGEVRLDYPTAMPVLRGAVAERPILGSGPNTFLYEFSKFKSQNFNLTPFWNVRFDKAPSEAAEYLVGTGILGFLAFEILAVIFLGYGLFFLVRGKDMDNWNLALTLFAGFTVLWVAHWFFFFNTVMAFAMWLAMGGFVALTRFSSGEKVKVSSFSFTASPRQTVSVVSVVSLSLVLLIILLFFSAAIYSSDIFYRRGLAESQDIKKYDQAQQDFETALRLNRFRPDYYLTYGEFLLLRINQELSQRQPNLSLIQTWLASSISTSRTAVDLSPANWTAWERLANLYAFARPLVGGVDKFIIDSLTKATAQDDKNPILWTELGQVYRLAARRIDPAILGSGPDSDGDGLSDQQERVLGCDPHNPSTVGDGITDGDKVLAGLSCSGSGVLPDSFLSQYIKTDAQSLLQARDAFQKAIDLKNDYATAYYQLALTYEQMNQNADAINTLEQSLQHIPANLDLKFELGKLYYNEGKIDLAARQFQQVVSLAPGNSNALFSLAVSDEQLGLTQQALNLYKKVLEINPGNQVIQAKIADLEKKLTVQNKKR